MKNKIKKNKLGILLLFSVFCFLFSWPVFAQDNFNINDLNLNIDLNDIPVAKSYVYDNFDVDIFINPDSTFTVEENETFKFTGGPWHYVFRGIAYKDLDSIKNIEVFGEDGNPWPSNALEIYNESGEKKIKINFEDLYDKTYTWKIKYTVTGGLGYYKTWDEIFWNVVPQNRDVNINQTKATIHLPKEVNKNDLKIASYIGFSGSKKSAEKSEIVDGKTMVFENGVLYPGDNFTIVAGWPRGVITRAIRWWKVGRNTTTVFGIIMPFLFALILFLVWLTHGRDRKMKAIFARYEPPKNMSPSLMGALYDEKVQTRDVNAIFINLAVLGYISIKEYKKGKYEFTKLKEADSKLAVYEKEFLKEMFSVEAGDNKKVTTEDLKYKFSDVLASTKATIYRDLKMKGYFKQSPNVIRGLYFGFGIGLLIVSFILIFFPLRFISVGWLSYGLFCSGILTIIISGAMPKRTEEGMKVLEEIIGFRDYLYTAERFRLGQVDLKKFEKFLPYAMVLKVEKEWANRFSDIYKEPPNWYMPYYAYSGMALMHGQMASDMAFSTSTFVNNISSMSSDVHSVMASVQSSGSGFGGGGGGGGGAGGGGGGGSGGAG
ncbi:MAG: DUF2207 domain-containing protein [Patescibacteria group bacterium]|jgi:uncharacterized membrane protein YgcG